MLADMLKSVLNDLNGSSADIEASAIISIDGLMMASNFSRADSKRFGKSSVPVSSAFFMVSLMVPVLLM